jgi:hypothetical protein
MEVVTAQSRNVEGVNQVADRCVSFFSKPVGALPGDVGLIRQLMFGMIGRRQNATLLVPVGRNGEAAFAETKPARR